MSNQTINPRDLSTRLTHIQKSNSVPNNGDSISRLPRISRVGTTSTTSSSSSHAFARLPMFSKSNTMSTTASDESSSSSHIEVMRKGPTARVQRYSAEVGPGQFSKPRAGERRRRESCASAKTVPEFRHYGRHSNDWLFNGYSVTGAVKKGWGKVFSGKNDE